MFKKLLNVGKGHSNDRLQQQQQQQQQKKNLFQLNEIKSYGFSHFACLGYSASLSLLAVGSKNGLLRVFGNPSVEFSYQLETGNAIRQIEFIDCRETSFVGVKDGKQKQQDGQKLRSSASAKLVVLTDNGQLHLFELKTIRPLNFADNTTQTDGSIANDCCQQNQHISNGNNQDAQQNLINGSEYTKLEYVRLLDYFTFKLDDEDRSKRVTTLEVSANGQFVFVGTEGGNLYQVPLDKFEPIKYVQQHANKLTDSVQRETGIRPIIEDVKEENSGESKAKDADDETTAVNLNDEPQIEQENVEPFDMIKFEEDVANQLGDDVKPKKQGAIESIKRHPASNDKLLLSYHRGLSIIYDVKNKEVDKYFYHNQILESSCFAGSQTGDFFYTSHNDGSYIKWDTRKGSQSKADEDFIGQLYGPYPCKPTPKIQSCTGLVNDQVEELVIFSGGMPRATYDDKNPVTIVRTEPDGKGTIKIVLDLTSKVLDFVIITRPRGNLGAGAKSTGVGKKNKNKQQQQQQQRNQQIAVALAILAEEEFVVVDLLNSESYLEFPLPYLNCVQPSAITCNQHYSDISDELYEQLLAFNKQQIRGKLSQNEWPITGGKVIEAPEVKSHDILLTGHEDGSVNIWDVSDLSMRHLLQLPTARFFSTEDDDLTPIDGHQDTTNSNQNSGSPNNESSNTQDSAAWPPLKRIGRFDPYSDDTRLAIRRISLCPQSGTLLVAGTGGQVLVFELKHESSELSSLVADEVAIVSDHRFTWKGREKLSARPGVHKFEPGYQLVSYVQLNPPASATSTDLRSDWHLFAVGTSYGFLLYDYVTKHCVVNRCTLNVQDFAIVSGDAGAGAMSRKKSFRKSLRESFRRLRRGRSQRNQPVAGATSPDQTGPKTAAFGRTTTGVRTLNASASNDTAQQAAAAHRNLYSGERQVEPKVELSSIVKCVTLTSAVIINNPACFKPSLWVGTNSGQVLVYAIDLASEQRPSSEQAPAPASSSSTSGEQSSDGQQQASSSSSTDASNSTSDSPRTGARLIKEVQLKHKAPIIAIFTSPEAPAQSAAGEPQVTAHDSAKSTPEKRASELFNSTDNKSTNDGADRKSQTIESEANEVAAPSEQRAQTPQAQQHQADKSPSKSSNKDNALHQQQPRVLICSEEQFKVFNLPSLKPFCKFKLTAHEGLRAKKISITQFLKPTNTRQPASVAWNATRSLQSFATQTSPPASPVPPMDLVASSPTTGEPPASESGLAAASTANGAHTSSKQAESNNNLLSALNNNHTSATTTRQKDKELLNAKFGAKANAANSSLDKTLTDSLEQQAAGANFEPYMVCMSNQGDCAIYSVPDLKRQAQIQVCKREDVNGITSAMLTNYGEGYYLKSSSNFLRFSISTQRVLRVLSVV